MGKQMFTKKVVQQIDKKSILKNTFLTFKIQVLNSIQWIIKTSNDDNERE